MGERCPLVVPRGWRQVARGLLVFAETESAVGAPGRTRTCDLEIRRLLLYPSELRGHVPAAGTGNARIVREHTAYRCGVSRVGHIERVGEIHL